MAQADRVKEPFLTVPDTGWQIQGAFLIVPCTGWQGQGAFFNSAWHRLAGSSCLLIQSQPLVVEPKCPFLPVPGTGWQIFSELIGGEGDYSPARQIYWQNTRQIITQITQHSNTKEIKTKVQFLEILAMKTKKSKFIFLNLCVWSRVFNFYLIYIYIYFFFK